VVKQKIVEEHRREENVFEKEPAQIDFPNLC